jgi:Flp pilus assembly protein TadB
VNARPARRSESSRPTEQLRREPRAPRAPVPADRAVRTERRRREQHLRRRRRDLLEDVAIAILLTIAALIWTAGLGVIAIIAVPIACAVIGSFLVERWLRKRRR